MYYHFKKIKSEKILPEEDIIVNAYGSLPRHFTVTHSMNMKVH